jgi:TonB family protein
MWEESLIESQHAASEHRKFLTFPAAVVIHTAVILGLAASNYAGIKAVNPTHIVPIFWKGDPPPKGTPEGTHREPSARTENTPPRETHLPEPTIVPFPLASDFSLEPQVETSGGEEGNGSGEGEPFGIPEGVDRAQGDWGIGLNEGTQLKEPEIEVIRPGVTQPVLIKRVEPAYPRPGIYGHIEGYVILKAVITKDGKVEVLSVMRSDHILLEKAALDAVRLWRYLPARVNNRPVAVYFQITVKFTLK